MSLVGTALYAAFAVGAPAGTMLYGNYGFSAVAVVATVIPLCALPLILMLRPVPLPLPASTGFKSVLQAVLVPGLGVALSGVGYGAITTFITLLFAERGWNSAWVAFTA